MWSTHLPLPVLLVLDDVLQLGVHLRQRRIQQLGPLLSSAKQNTCQPPVSCALPNSLRQGQPVDQHCPQAAWPSQLDPIPLFGCFSDSEEQSLQDRGRHAHSLSRLQKDFRKEHLARIKTRTVTFALAGSSASRLYDSSFVLGVCRQDRLTWSQERADACCAVHASDHKLLHEALYRNNDRRYRPHLMCKCLGRHHLQRPETRCWLKWTR